MKDSGALEYETSGNY